MATNVEPEEAAALRGPREARADAAQEVVQRDFRKPRRFSGSALDDFRHRIEQAIPEIAEALRALFKVPLRISVEDVCEVGAEGLFDDMQKPFALGAFEVASQPGWIRWDPLAAVQAIEMLLGSGGASRARELSDIEGLFLRQVFATAVDHVTRALGVKATAPVVVHALEEVADWRDGGEKAEPHRLSAAVRIEGLGDPSRFHLYLPGFQDGAHASAAAEALALPPHLGRVQVELGAHLGASDVPLDDLLGLEVGDVIPLATLIGTPLVLRVEGIPCGSAELGSLRGNRAVRILALDPHTEDNV